MQNVFKGIDHGLDSPRVKHREVKACFSIPWFYITLVKTND